MIDGLTPDPLASIQQYNRFCHRDLPMLEDIELTDELDYLRPLLRALDSGHWCRQRVTALKEELERREDNRHDFTEGHKPKLAEGVNL